MSFVEMDLPFLQKSLPHLERFRTARKERRLATTQSDYDVQDLAQSQMGRLRIEWADSQMPVLQIIRERFRREKPLTGVKLAACRARPKCGHCVERIM